MELAESKRRLCWPCQFCWQFCNHRLATDTALSLLTDRQGHACRCNMRRIPLADYHLTALLSHGHFMHP